MDFLTGEELLARCEDSGLLISGVMKRRETDNTEQSEEIVDALSLIHISSRSIMQILQRNGTVAMMLLWTS